jgi:hypothetical protein
VYLLFSLFFCSHLYLQDLNYGMRTPRKPAGYTAPAGGMYSGAGHGSGMMARNLAAAAGTPSNLGMIGNAGTFLPVTLTCIIYLILSYSIG